MALRRLRLVNCHTGETFDGAYRNDQGPIPRVIDELCVFLRDHHSGAVIAYDVGVIDFLVQVMDAVGAERAALFGESGAACRDAVCGHIPGAELGAELSRAGAHRRHPGGG